MQTQSQVPLLTLRMQTRHQDCKHQMSQRTHGFQLPQDTACLQGLQQLLMLLSMPRHSHRSSRSLDSLSHMSQYLPIQILTPAMHTHLHTSSRSCQVSYRGLAAIADAVEHALSFSSELTCILWFSTSSVQWVEVLSQEGGKVARGHVFGKTLFLQDRLSCVC